MPILGGGQAFPLGGIGGSGGNLPYLWRVPSESPIMTALDATHTLDFLEGKSSWEFWSFLQWNNSGGVVTQNAATCITRYGNRSEVADVPEWIHFYRFHSTTYTWNFLKGPVVDDTRIFTFCNATNLANNRQLDLRINLDTLELSWHAEGDNYAPSVSLTSATCWGE